jgi:brefeldin A-resistance guanine nucleotide exchange factor 1
MNGVSNTLRSSSNSAVQKKATMTDSTVANGTAAQSPHADCVDTDIRVLDKSVAGPSTGMPTRFILEPVKASRVLKGEIHNLLTVMRAEEYVSPQRFVEEFDPIHPLAAKLEHVHNLLGNNNQMDPLLLRTYLRPFCEAVKGRDIRAPVTGAALSALHKFLLYGFVVPSQSEASSVLTMIAECLLECRFEEPDDPKSRTANTKVSLNASRATHGALTPAQQEEQVVLKLLDLAALTVRCSLQDVALLSANLMVGLLETCLHVSHHAKRASPLLKSAAADALGQIVLQVFAASGGPALEARHQILCKLAWLLNPSHQTPHVTMTSLTLINIALETCQEELSDADVAILQDDLCKYLLLASTTHDLYILNLTLRVIFNLFQSIRNHLKVPLEVFLTSVHLRILEAPVMEEREVALESLLEFCQEPELMQDIYLNYDCDVACTNLFESIVHSLGKVALPTDYKFGEEKNSTSAGNSGSKDNASSAQVVNVTSTHTSHPSSVQVEPAPLNHLNRLALEGLLAILDSIAKRCTDAPLGREQVGRTSSAMSVTSDDCLTGDDESTGAHLETAPVSSLRRQKTDEELRETKLRKKSLAKVAQAFNDRPMGTAWIEIAIEENVLTDKDNVEGVAKLLYTAPGLDKVELGIYLSKGPDSDYPFIVAVRKQFVGLFDFHGLKFAGAIRKFLSKFRLPGEAQCIDRLMESFSAELYNQQGAASFFANADAVYVMSFSTIMLNTDLHNPHIASQNRMTLKQFIKNNKGINGGKDLPEEFLTDLYEEIRKKQIQVRKEMGEIMRKHENVDFRTAWEGIMSKAEEVQRPFFGPSDGSRRQTEAGLHDKEMFEILSKWLLADLVGVYLRSWDDALVVKALNGLKQMTKVAAHFDLDETVNDVLEALLPMGRDYVMGCVALDFEKLEEENNDDNSVMSGSRTLDSVEANSQDGTAFGADQPIPYSLLCSSNKLGRPDIYGSAAHRGILALDCSFVLLQQYGSRVSSAWPSFIECLCALRDARALPAGLADLDDFADSNGNVLPLSPFAKESNQRLKHFYCAQQDDTPAVSSPKGWLRSLFKKRDARDVDSIADDASYNYSKRELSTYAKALLGIAEAADVENVIQMGSTKLPAAEQTIESLLVTVSNYPYQDDPVLEQHAIFSLELAARALLSNRNRAPRLYPLFLDTFEKILGKVSDARVPAPFVVERIVVTVLRACIHLYDLPEVRFTVSRCIT